MKLILVCWSMILNCIYKYKIVMFIYIRKFIKKQLLFISFYVLLMYRSQFYFSCINLILIIIIIFLNL